MELFAKHRVESLTDGIFSVALTLLVLDLKLPGPPYATTDAELQSQLVAILPKLAIWLVSFAVLMLFWNGYHRMFHRMRSIDRVIMLINFVYLGLICIAPFVVATWGAHIELYSAQLMYNTMLALCALTQIAMLEYTRRHPELLVEPWTRGTLARVRIQVGALVFCAVCSSIVSAIVDQSYGLPYLLMFFSGFIGRRVERRIDGVRPAREQHASGR
jgi:uncharacterized membrane protein